MSDSIVHNVEILDNEVMAVAIVDEGERTWYAVIGAFEPTDDDELMAAEKQVVGSTGTRLTFGIAKNIFPALAERNRWRG